MNDKNLIPFTKKTAAANGAKGGRASGESKRERKRIKELIAELMEQDAPATDTMFTDYKLDFYTNAAIIAMKLIDRAKSGDVKALRLLLEIVGELERGNRVTVNTNIDNIEETEAYQKGYKAGQTDVFKRMTDQELYAMIERTKNNIQIAEDEKPLVMPNGTIICGESQLED